MAINNPQERYDTTMEVRRLPNGRMVYRSLRPKSIKISPGTDIEIAATDATRMDKVAHDVYGSAMTWWRIASANGRVDGSLYFKPGTKIIIPTK